MIYGGDDKKDEEEREEKKKEKKKKKKREKKKKKRTKDRRGTFYLRVLCTYGAQSQKLSLFFFSFFQ